MTRRVDTIGTGRPPGSSLPEAVDRLWERSSQQARAQLRLEAELRLLTQAVGGLREETRGLAAAVKDHGERIGAASGGWTAGKGVLALTGGLILTGIGWWMSMTGTAVRTAQATADMAARAQDRAEVRARYAAQAASDEREALAKDLAQLRRVVDAMREAPRARGRR